MKINKKGFTLVELVIVIAVIAILAGVLIPTFTGILNRAKESTRLSTARTIRDEYTSAQFNSIEDSVGYVIEVDSTHLYEITDKGNGFNIVASLDEIENGYAYSENNYVVSSGIKIYKPSELVPEETSYALIDGEVVSWEDLIEEKYIYVSPAGVLQLNEKAQVISTLALDESVKVIPDMAFYGFRNLTQLYIPSSVVSVGEGAFMFCEKLVQVKNLGAPFDDMCNYDYEWDETKEYVTTEDGQFQNELTIGEKYITYKIGNETYLLGFSNPNELYADDIPSSVTDIYPRAFAYTKVVSATFPETILGVSYAIFEGCTNLVRFKNLTGQNVEVPSSPALEVITSPNAEFTCTIQVVANKYVISRKGGEVYFVGLVDDTITEVKDLATLVPDLTYINDRALYGSNIKEFYIPDTVKTIGNYAFAECIDLHNVEMGNSVETIGTWAFYVCRSLLTINPDGLYGIVFPSSLKTIGEHAFNCCSSMYSVKIPSSVTSIGYMALANNRKMVRLLNLSNVNINSNSIIFCNDVLEARTNENFSYTLTVGDKYTTYTKGGKTYLWGFANGNVTTVNDDIPAGVTNISDNAFNYNSNLTSVTISANVVYLQFVNIYDPIV